MGSGWHTLDRSTETANFESLLAVVGICLTGRLRELTLILLEVSGVRLTGRMRELTLTAYWQ
jgi:hypothetical protein